MSPSASSASLLARDLTLSFGPRTVLDGLSLSVAPGSRIGVVAPNGAGKTTLLRVLAGEIGPDRGTVRRSPPTATVGYLPQEPERREHESVAHFLARRTGVAAASAELDAASHSLGSAEPRADERYAGALERWLALGAADFEARAGTVWNDIGLGAGLLEQPMATLSGGEAARASLAAILLSRFDILLLDEPTNDLDFDGLERLEGFLGGGVTFVVVSHDRAFLERTIDTVVELDDHTHRAMEFAGGWLAYLEERATARRHAEEEYEVYRARRDELLGRARAQRQWAVTGVRKAKRQPKDNDKAQRDFFLNRTEKQAAKVRITEKALDRLEEVEKPWQDWRLQLELAAAPRSGDVVARLSNAVVERGSFRLGPIDLDVGWAERLAIVGPNGSGKSTLLGALFGSIPLASGDAWLGPGVVVGEIDQARKLFTAERPLLDTFAIASGLVPRDARSLLAKFGLDADRVVRRTATLSPGERTRAVLALLMAKGVNCLVLDEPTNHLDLPAIEELERALATWPGTLLLVTHDRRLLENARVDRTLRLSRGGGLTVQA